MLSYQIFCILKQKLELESSKQHFPVDSAFIKIWRLKGAYSRLYVQSENKKNVQFLMRFKSDIFWKRGDRNGLIYHILWHWWHFSEFLWSLTSVFLCFGGIFVCLQSILQCFFLFLLDIKQIGVPNYCLTKEKGDLFFCWLFWLLNKCFLILPSATCRIFKVCN